MKKNSSHLILNTACWMALSFLTGSSFLLAQDSAAPPQEQGSGPDGVWHRMNTAPPPADTNVNPNVADSTAADPNSADVNPPTADVEANAPQVQNGTDNNGANQSPNNVPYQAPNNAPYQGPNAPYQSPNAPYQSPNTGGYQGQNPNPNPPPGAPNYAPPVAVPPRLTLAAGTFIRVRINQPLSSDHNQAGDAFSASLLDPVVVDGVIVAQRGQTIGGRVTEAEKAARSGDSPSRLGVQLTDLTLVDGQVVQIQTQLISRTGPSAAGRNTGAILGTTALGAIIGAAAGGGPGAAIGAGAGAAAGTIGVLVARGRPTVIVPESILTFRVEAPLTITTDRAPQAFRYLNTSNDYNRPPGMQPRMTSTAGPGYGYAPPPPPAYYGYGYPYYPYYYGPGFGLYYGPGFYYGGGVIIGRGFYRGGFRR